MAPLCSVIMPLFNCEAHVAASIDSVLAQRLTDWELIIVDDASSDASASIAQGYADQDARIRLLRLPHNVGAAQARNTALEMASGRYIAFLDSDDLWLPQKLSTQLAFMQDRQIAFSFSAYEKIDAHGAVVAWMGVPERVNSAQLLKCCVIGCLTAVYDSHALGKVPMPLLRKRQDYALWLTLLKKTTWAYGITEPLAQYRLRSGALSASKVRTIGYTWQVYRQVEKLNTVQALYCLMHYGMRGLLRLKFPRLARRLGVLHPSHKTLRSYRTSGNSGS